MEILTPSGYKNILSCSIGDEVVAYDLADGHYFTNKIEKIEQWEDTSSFYSINDTYNLYKWQSVWANMNVTHAELLQVGDTIYDDQDQDIIITSITPSTASIGWYRLSISGDHSYIADGLTLHNANRYWVGGGSSVNWNAAGPTNWSSGSGGANNASAPTTSDDVLFTAAGANANGNSTISTAFSIASLFISSAYTATLTHNNTLTVGGSITLAPNYTASVGATNTIIVSPASTTAILTSNGKVLPNNINMTGAATKSLADDWRTTGNLTLTTGPVNGNNIYVGGNCTNTNTIVGTTVIWLTGTGTLSSTQNFQNSFNISSSGTVTTGASLGLGGAQTYNYITGTVNTTTNNTTLTVGISTINFPGITWPNAVIGANVSNTVSLLSQLLVSGSLTVTSTTTTAIFSGSAGFTVGSLACQNTTVATTITLQNNVNYYVSSSLLASGSRVSTPLLFTSDHASNRANLILLPGASCNVLANFTRINASGGRPIYTFAGTVTDCINIKSFTQLRTAGFAI